MYNMADETDETDYDPFWLIKNRNVVGYIPLLFHESHQIPSEC